MLSNEVNVSELTFEMTKRLRGYLSTLVERGGSDLHVKTGSIVRARINGEIVSLGDEVLTHSDGITLAKELLRRRFNELVERKSIDFTFKLNEMYRFRVNLFFQMEGVSAVFRTIPTELPTFASLKLPSVVEKFCRLSRGMILVTGPTGSGKTTTLYSILKELNSEEKKIITVEDPVEYKIDSICQVAINNKIGLNFELVLKNILRQDPDIIFIGEIRDKFSLDIALQASLTGHLVIASIHANNALETISRLIDLQADPFLISSTLKIIMAQRLVLNYCSYCEAQGCEKCNFTKYYDRSSIAEVLKIDEKMSSFIFRKASLNEIKEYLISIDFKTILDDGKQKVDLKITSLDEVYKVISY